jgi:hypothetical protein
VVPTVEEELDGMIPRRGGEGQVDSTAPRCGDGVEAVRVVAAWT